MKGPATLEISRCGFGISLVIFASASLAADLHTPVPRGWTAAVNTSPFAFSPEGIALAVFRYKDDPPPGSTTVDQSRVIQIANGNILSQTDFTGKTVGLAYSRDGQILLVRNLDPASGMQVHAMDTTGAVAWTKNDNRVFSFSTTGESIFAVTPRGLFRLDNAVEFFDLAGNSINQLTVDRAIWGAMALGAGDGVIVAMENSLLRLSVEAPPATTWTVTPDPAPSRFEWAGFRCLDSQRILARQFWGEFMVVTTSGAVSYRHDPFELANNDPENGPGDYAEYDAFAIEGSSDLLLFDGSTRGYRVDAATHDLTPVVLDSAGPSGTVTKKWVQYNRILILASDSITLRDLNL
jgi:hypothetical protein